METKHTQGPWMVRPDGKHVMTQWQNTFDSRLPICDFPYTNEDNEANARLIAAAPELLEALREMLAEYGDGSGNAVLIAAAHALAKAEGR